MTQPQIIIGSRTSRLAMWQTEQIIALLKQAWPGLDCQVEPFVTKGDKTVGILSIRDVLGAYTDED